MTGVNDSSFCRKGNYQEKGFLCKLIFLESFKVLIIDKFASLKVFQGIIVDLREKKLCKTNKDVIFRKSTGWINSLVCFRSLNFILSFWDIYRNLGFKIMRYIFEFWSWKFICYMYKTSIHLNISSKFDKNLYTSLFSNF